MTTESNPNDTSHPPEEQRGEKIKTRVPRSLKTAVWFVGIYGVLVLLDAILGGASAYQLGGAFGSVAACAVIIWALLRVKKYGWGFSVFWICAKIFVHISDYGQVLDVITDPAVLNAIFIGIVFYIALLIGALIALVMPNSREPFKKLRQHTE